MRIDLFRWFMAKVISILDYGAGNIHSVGNALSFLGFNYEIIHDQDDVLKASCLLVPGQGAFVQAMTNLEKLNLKDVLIKHIRQQKPYMGICLGFQILFESSQEHGGCKGLGIYAGRFESFDEKKCVVPHMGWNQLHSNENKHMFWPFKQDNAYVYFDHSYYLNHYEDKISVAYCKYYNKFPAVIADKAVFATQFHPEKSGEFGLEIMKQFFKQVL